MIEEVVVAKPKKHKRLKKKVKLSLVDEVEIPEADDEVTLSDVHLDTYMRDTAMSFDISKTSDMCIFVHILCVLS